MAKRVSKSQRDANRLAAHTMHAMQAQVMAQMMPALEAVGASLFDGGGYGSEPPPSKDPGWRPAPRDARSDTLRRLPLQRAQSRDLARTSPIAAGAINTNVDRVVGTGLALVSQPHLVVLGWSAERAAEWKANFVQPEFSIWADSPLSDAEETHTFYQQQSIVLRGSLESGDCFTLLPDGEISADMPYALRTQVLEADRVGNPEGQSDTALMAAGVRLNARGAPEAYHLYDQHPGALCGWGAGGSSRKGEWIERVGRSGRRRMLHHFRKLRPGMPRGLPYLAPIVDCIKQMARYTEAEIMAAVISACVTAFVTVPAGTNNPLDRPTKGKGGGKRYESMLSHGAAVTLRPGEEVSFPTPGRPSPNFDPFVMAVIKQIGMALGIPYELLIKQFNSSYSASKAALLDAWVYFRNVRNWLSLSFCQPVFETWMAEAVALGRVPAPGFFADVRLRWAYTRAAWHGDSMGSISPKDEVAAYTAAIDAGLITRERAEWELWGSDWNDTYGQKLAEHRRLEKDGMLPAPKPGAAAPGPAPQPEPANDDTPEGIHA